MADSPVEVNKITERWQSRKQRLSTWEVVSVLTNMTVFRIVT
jgi:hypothetical protein